MYKKAFTLIELMIVIVLIGLVYTLAINKLSQFSKQTTALSLLNLKNYLHHQNYKKTSKIICFDNCLECKLVLDGKIVKDLDIHLDKGIKKYIFLENDFLERDSDVFFDKDLEKDVCFSYSVDFKGIGEQVIVQYKKKYYDFRSYLSEPIVYKSLSDIREYQDNLKQKLIK